MTSNPTNTKHMDINVETDIRECDGCGKQLIFGYIDTPPERGDPCNLVQEAGHEALYCSDCYTRRPKGTPYDHKDLDSEQLKLDDEIV